MMAAVMGTFLVIILIIVMVLLISCVKIVRQAQALVVRLGAYQSQFGKKESIKDTARVLGRMYEGIEYRGFGQEIVEELAQYAGVPVWNGLTNEYHPTQMLADMLTIREHFGKLKGLKLVYMGDARYNMGNSLMIACAKLGLDFVACTTEDYFPNEELVEECRVYAKKNQVLKLH